MMRSATLRMGLAALGLGVCAGCARSGTASQRAPTAAEVGNLTYAVQGLEEDDSLTLTGGRFKGMNGGMKVEVMLLGASLRPLTDTSRLVTADLDGDGRREAAVVQIDWLGGTGFFYDLVLVGERHGKLAELARAGLGDRVDVRSLEAVATPAGPQLRVSRSAGWLCPGWHTVERYRFARARRPGERDTLVLAADSPYARPAGARPC